MPHMSTTKKGRLCFFWHFEKCNKWGPATATDDDGSDEDYDDDDDNNNDDDDDDDI